MMRDATLEEMWRIKEELSTAHDSWEDYLAELFAYQEEERRRGVKFVSFSTAKTENGIPDMTTPSVAEDGPKYDASATP